MTEKDDIRFMEGKRKFIEDLTRTVTQDILANLQRLPAEWDGIELRQYITDQFARQVHWTRGHNKRKREYRNRVVVDNL